MRLAAIEMDVSHRIDTSFDLIAADDVLFVLCSYSPNVREVFLSTS